jgi:4'-phosphopantetheinyl transferase
MPGSAHVQLTAQEDPTTTEEERTMTYEASGRTWGPCESPADSRDASHVDVWCLPLVRPAADAERLGAILSDEERALLQRIASPARRDRTSIAWGSRRIFLARALGCAPRDVSIVRSRNGAPTLADSGCRLHFSLSHSGEAMLFALSNATRVGADIERIDGGVDVVRLARRFFPTAEAQAIGALSPPDARNLFYRLWARKEAILKATGGGVPSRLRTLSLPQGDDRGRLKVGTETWTVCDLPRIAGYAAAVAAEGAAAIRFHGAMGDDSECSVSPARP